MGGLTIGRKLGFSFALLVALLLASGVLSYRGIVTATGLSHRIAEEDADHMAIALDLKTHVLGLRRYEKDLYLNIDDATKRGEYLAKWNEQLEELTGGLNDIGKHVAAAAAEEGWQRAVSEQVEGSRGGLQTYAQLFRQSAQMASAGQLLTPQDGNRAIGPAKDAIHAIVSATDEIANTFVANMKGNVLQADETRSETASTVVIFALLAVVLGVVIAVIMARAVATPLVELAGIAQQMSEGNLAVRISSNGRSDEVGILQNAFGKMGDNLRAMLGELTGGVGTLSQNAAELSTTAKQYAAGASEQAASVAEVSSTVEELQQTSLSASQSAREVVAAAESAVDVGLRGSEAVDNTVKIMEVVRDRVSGIAEQILALSERTGQIGEIVASVNDLAEQSNLLAVNASIEAAKAGEQGRGFAVVASEVRTLAERSKQSTQQIRTILSEIQRATESAVMATEEGTKRVEDGNEALSAVRSSIEQLSEVLQDNADRARQIAGAAGQQASGISQISSAMGGIATAGQESSAGARQIEITAGRLDGFVGQLKSLTAAYRI